MYEAARGEAQGGHMGPFWPMLRLGKLKGGLNETAYATGVGRVRCGVV